MPNSTPLIRLQLLCKFCKKNEARYSKSESTIPTACALCAMQFEPLFVRIIDFDINVAAANNSIDIMSILDQMYSEMKEGLDVS